MKNILIIHTGGTISMAENKEKGVVEEKDEHPLSKTIEDDLQRFAKITEMNIFSLPSPHMTSNHMLQLAQTIEEEITKFDGVIVTHGTDTLEETAYFLDLVLTTNKPVIVTGAMRSSNEIGSDALYNLLCSIRVALNEQAQAKGVLVVMNGEIHQAEYVTKQSSIDLATFKSPNHGPIGIVTNVKVIFYPYIKNRNPFKINDVNKKVYLIKSFTDIDDSFIEAIAQLNPDGIVIEAFGQGNLPKEVVPALKNIIDKKIPVVIVSRCNHSIVQPKYNYDGGGKQLHDLGVILVSGLSGQKARIKLLVALAAMSNIERIREVFQE